MTTLNDGTNCMIFDSNALSALFLVMEMVLFINLLTKFQLAVALNNSITKFLTIIHVGYTLYPYYCQWRSWQTCLPCERSLTFIATTHVHVYEYSCIPLIFCGNCLGISNAKAIRCVTLQLYSVPFLLDATTSPYDFHICASVGTYLFRRS